MALLTFLALSICISISHNTRSAIHAACVNNIHMAVFVWFNIRSFAVYFQSILWCVIESNVSSYSLLLTPVSHSLWMHSTQVQLWWTKTAAEVIHSAFTTNLPNLPLLLSLDTETTAIRIQELPVRATHRALLHNTIYKLTPVLVLVVLQS